MWRLFLVGLLLFSCTPKVGNGQNIQSPTGAPQTKQNSKAQKNQTPQKTPSVEPGAYFENMSSSEPAGLAKDAFSLIIQHYQTIGAPKPFFDDRLSIAAYAYAENVPESGSLPRSFVDFHLAKQGIAEPYPKIISFAFSEKAKGQFLNKLESAMQRIIPSADVAEKRIGIGVAKREKQVHVVLAILPGRLSLQDVSKTASPGTMLSIQGDLEGNFLSPRLVITSPDGKTTTVRSQDQANQPFSLLAKLDAGKGRYEIEIVADGKTGPEVCGLFSVYAGTPFPSAPAISSIPVRENPVTPEEAEQIIFDLVNQERSKLGLLPLKPLESAQVVARAYSEEMKTTERVGHISPISGKPEDRLQKAGLKPSLVLENVARSYSPEDAHAGLMESPGHRANILNARVTHLGIGVAVALDPNSPPAYYVTQSFIRIGAPSLKTLRKELPDVLVKGRKDFGLPPLQEDTKLSELASRYLEKFESGELNQEAITKALFADLAPFGNTYAVAAPLAIVLPFLDPIEKAKGLNDKQFTHYGAAMKVSKKNSPLGPGQVVLILILAGLR